MADVLVVGYGSELRRDDAAGRHVADGIGRRAIAGVTVRTSTQLVPEMVEPISAVDCVVFVDASVDARAVTVRRVVPQVHPADSHHATPCGLLGLAGSLGLVCPPAFLVEVPAFDLSPGEGLSEATAAEVDRAVDEVTALIDTVSGLRTPDRTR